MHSTFTGALTHSKIFSKSALATWKSIVNSLEISYSLVTQSTCVSFLTCGAMCLSSTSLSSNSLIWVGSVLAHELKILLRERCELTERLADAHPLLLSVRGSW